MKKTLGLALVLTLAFASSAWADSIKLGFNIPLTGDIPDVGQSSKNAAEMLKAKINGAGGVDIKGKKYTLEFVYEDNESKPESAVRAATKLITEDAILAMVGPQGSGRAVPAGQTANDSKTVMISPWSTNPNTTLNRPYVYRGCFLDPFQGPVVAKFATEELKAKKAAVLYDKASDYPKGLAEFFKKAFEEIHGAGSVVAFESFNTGDVDFSAQLTNIISSGADLLFTPQYYNEVPLIVKQAKELGWEKPIVGSDSWGGGDLMGLCGDDCKGYYFSTHYAAAGARGATKDFIDEYAKQFGKTPDDVAALTWDSTNLLLMAIQDAGLTGDLNKDRENIRVAMSKIKEFPGITGTMNFSKGNDPEKCAVVVKIDDQGQYSFFQSVCP
ncbi:ABC transporter substrate-binding protein [Megalodesulfovibrio gigas]|uniref:Putative Extracellular ligand-binding receptor n=1 Tax=Megalodesulfovibrio gigas (strain ATCC 19364 / DSM 1382 / NCIMB 9332 / VKM B-1759) TaxID=1121448 RepID=T2GDX2_MEGG1|nr:ABC transporter substrate-binding protein [Megalodesulfovibrio gigas]AGW14379.1 putative Extracellular ligand-binding receptor [Megalodesulfovibrio gigas DSM 1382 = ATCC 19364]